MVVDIRKGVRDYFGDGSDMTKEVKYADLLPSPADRSSSSSTTTTAAGKPGTDGGGGGDDSDMKSLCPVGTIASLYDNTRKIDLLKGALKVRRRRSSSSSSSSSSTLVMRVSDS